MPYWYRLVPQQRIVSILPNQASKRLGYVWPVAKRPTHRHLDSSAGRRFGSQQSAKKSTHQTVCPQPRLVTIMCRLENIVYAHCEHPGPYRIVDCAETTTSEQKMNSIKKVNQHTDSSSVDEIRKPICCRSLSNAPALTTAESQKLVDVEFVYDMECYDCHHARRCVENLTMSGALDGGLESIEKRKAAIADGPWGFKKAAVKEAGR